MSSVLHNVVPLVCCSVTCVVVVCGCYRMWGQPAGECWKLLLSWFSQRLLSVRSLCLEDFCHPWREGE